MRARSLVLAVMLSLVACGGEEFSGGGESGGAGGAAGSGGSGAGNGGSGGSNAGSGGADAGSGGKAGGGGSDAGGGGASGSGAGGSEAGSGGSDAGQGGSDAGQGGSDAGQAGAAGSAGEGGTAGSAGEGGAGQGGAAGGGPVPISVVQATETAISTQDTPALTLASLPAPGNAILVGATCISDFKINNEGDCGIPSGGGVTDNHGNAYTRVVQGESIKSSSQGARGYLFIAHAISLGAESAFEIRVNPDGAVPGNNQRVVWGAIEVAGLVASSSLDAWGSSLVGGTDKTSTTATTDLATSQGNTLAVAVLSMRSNDTNMLITPESSWAQHHAHQNGASDLPGHSMVSRILDVAGPVSHTWTHDNPTRGVAAIIATFKGAAP